MSPAGVPVPFLSHRLSSGLYRRKIPSIARYESWKPAEVTADGVMASCMRRAMQKILMLSRLLPVSRAHSLRRIKKNALTRDGAAPVITVKNAEPATMTADLQMRTQRVFPRNESILDTTRYMMLKCIPDRASRCDAPLSLKASLMPVPRSLWSPVRNALTRALLPASANGIESMSDLRCTAQISAMPGVSGADI